MKLENVPQDESSLSKDNIKELCYATDKDGKYVTALSSGWEVKSLALQTTMEDIEERVQIALKKIQANEASPILYFQEINRMDLETLASYVGKWKFFVKRHLKPSGFKGLTERTLQKYASIFDITIDELKNFDPKNVK